jgi:hypothetical protein
MLLGIIDQVLLVLLLVQSIALTYSNAFAYHFLYHSKYQLIVFYLNFLHILYVYPQ